jgi:feruloyl-CoA synthase
LIRDAVITGENREELGALVIASMPPLRELVGASNTEMTDDDVLAHPLVRDALVAALQRHQRRATGSATRVARLLVIREAPRLDKGEITDKGSLNQRAMLSLRKDLVEQLYLGSPDVITVGKDMAA